MLGENVGAAAFEFHGQSGGEGATAIMSVDDVQFARTQFAPEGSDGGPIDKAAFFDDDMLDAIGAGAISQGGYPGAGDAGDGASEAQAAGEIEHVALGAGKDIGVGEEGDAEGVEGEVRGQVRFREDRTNGTDGTNGTYERRIALQETRDSGSWIRLGFRKGRFRSA